MTEDELRPVSISHNMSQAMDTYLQNLTRHSEVSDLWHETLSWSLQKTGSCLFSPAPTFSPIQQGYLTGAPRTP